MVCRTSLIAVFVHRIERGCGKKNSKYLQTDKKFDFSFIGCIDRFVCIPT